VIDLDVDPPPDLWIEVDNRVSSAGRLPVYAALGVPEVWTFRARKGTLRFAALDGDAYRPIDRSLSLNGLTPAIVLELLAEADRLGETRWDIWMRDWMRTNLTHTHERP
jgi:Uma2 family endonuclease